MKRNRSSFDKYFLFVEAPVSTSTRRMTDDRVWVPSLPPPRPMGPCRKVPSRKEGTVKCLFEFSPGLLLEIRAGNLSILREQETFGNFSGKRAPFHRKFHHPSAASLFSFLSLFFYFSSPAGNLFEETREDGRWSIDPLPRKICIILSRTKIKLFISRHVDADSFTPFCRRFVQKRVVSELEILIVLTVNVNHFFLFFFIVQGIVPLKKRNKREENKGKKKLDLLYRSHEKIQRTISRFRPTFSSQISFLGINVPLGLLNNPSHKSVCYPFLLHHSSFFFFFFFFPPFVPSLSLCLRQKLIIPFK